MNESHRISKWSDFPWWLQLAAILAAVNSTTFQIIAFAVGGFAQQGYTQGGRYFLRFYGTHTEVSATRWTYSLCHEYSVWVTHLGVFVAMAVFVNSVRGRVTA